MKADLDYDVFIDDSPLNAIKFLENNKKMILYSQPWNQHICNDKLFRISNLSEAIEIIKLILIFYKLSNVYLMSISNMSHMACSH